MKSIVVVITLVVGFCCSTQAQGDALDAQIRSYLAVNGTIAQYDQAYDGMFTLIESQFTDSEVPTELWDSLKATKSDDIGEIVSMLTAVYRKYFSTQDVERMAKHFSLQGADREADKSDFLNSEAGQKMIQVQNDLVADIGQTSEYWSRDLYLKTLEKLSEKGFHPKQ